MSSPESFQYTHLLGKESFQFLLIKDTITVDVWEKRDIRGQRFG